MRKEVQWFAELMNQRLEENAHKDKYGWKDIAFDDLTQQVDRLNTELQLVNNDREAMKKAIDIANYAMMIADNIKIRS